jgi:tetratricopeptide (TPR) repeat protein
LSLPVRLALIAFLGFSCAAGRRPPVLEKRQVSEEEAPERFASARAYAHYVRARLAEERGDFRAAAEELRGALVFDDTSAQLHFALAEVLSRMVQLAAAEDEARRALDGDPQGPAGAEALTLLGKIHAAQRRRDLAIEDVRGAIKLQIALAKERGEEEGRVDPDPWRVLAELYLESGDERAAARTYEDLAVHVPGEGSGLREMGRMYLERRDFTRAEKYLKKSLEKDPRDLEAWHRMALLEEARRRPTEARKAYEAVLALDSDDLDALLALGKLALGASDMAGARAYFAQLLRLAPEEGSARVNVSLAWLEARRPAEALAVVEEGLKDGASDSRLRFVQGVVLQDQRKWNEAARAYGAVGSEDGDLWANARMNLAYCLAQVSRYGEAARALQKPMAARPRDARLVTMMAYVLERGGKLGDAVKLLEKAVKAREGDPAGLDGTSELYEALASSLEKSGRKADAIAVLKRAIGQRPRDGLLLYALGATYEKAGDHEAAVAQMKALLVIDPDHADALNFVGYSYAERGVRLDEAEKLIGKALELRPENGFFLDSLGWLYFQRGDYAKAVGALEKADALSGPEPTILEHLGDAYRSVHRPSDAATAYRRALKSFEGGAEPERPGQQQGIERKLRELGTELRPAQR